MTQSFPRAAAFALAAVVTTMTFAAANVMALHAYKRADAVAMANMQVLAAQTVVVVGHRA